MTARRVQRVLGAAAAVLAIGLVQFAFNPLGLGPEPASVLEPAFFETTVRDDRDIELLVDGEAAFGAVFAALGEAAESVHIQTYIWKDDATGRAVVEKLRAAADRGVAVTVNKDLLGTFFELGDVVKGRPSPVFTEKGLKGYPNIDVDTRLLAYNDHSKYFIVDHETLIFGGMNIADEYHFQWHDYMGLVRGRDRVALFENRVLRGRPWPGGLPAVVAVNDGHATEIRTGLREMIDHARERVVVQHAYFSDEVVLDALLRAAARGVAVDVMLPSDPDTHGYANKVTVNRLLASEHRDRVRVFLYPGMSHAKVLLADGQIAAVGSANLTPRSMLTSKELTLFVHWKPEQRFVRDLREQLEADLAKSREVREPFRLSLVDRVLAMAGKYTW